MRGGGGYFVLGHFLFPDRGKLKVLSGVKFTLKPPLPNKNKKQKQKTCTELLLKMLNGQEELCADEKNAIIQKLNDWKNASLGVL